MKGKKTMICMALAAILAAGSVPAYGAVYDTIPHTFTAKVGTTEFRKDGEARPLDVPVYIKDGYTMLPLRTFMDAAMVNPQMTWDGEKQQAWVVDGSHAVCFDMKYNTIIRNGVSLPVFGKMEVKDGRVFVPLRNWGNILQELGFVVGENDITWDAGTKTATVKVAEKKPADPDAGLEKPTVSGAGEQADFAVALTTEYDEMKNLGDGYFLLEKDTDPAPGSSIRDLQYSIIDLKTGKIIKTFETGTVLEDLGEGYLLADHWREDIYDIVKKESGEAVADFSMIGVPRGLSEGMVLFQNGATEKWGYYALGSGKIIEARYENAKEFSEGLAPVCVQKGYKLVDRNYELIEKWNYIDKAGKTVLETAYTWAMPFSEGLATVKTKDGYGYINKEGNEIIPCQYRWGGNFRDGKTYVTDAEKNTWLINTKGEKLKKIAEDSYLIYATDDMDDVGGRKNGLLLAQESVDLPGGDHYHVTLYYDETGQISKEAYLLKKDCSEGLAPYQDEETKKYGYVDETGKWVIAPVFDRASAFADGYAAVGVQFQKESGGFDMEWGIIKHPGK